MNDRTRKTRTLVGIVLAASALIGCPPAGQRQSDGLAGVGSDVAQVQAIPQRYVFTQFGEIPDSQLYGQAGVSCADFDGDGDIDIVVTRYRGRVTIYENRIPRQSYTQLEQR